MTTTTTYTEGFRKRMVQRMTGPTAMSATKLADEVGVAQATLSRWLLAASKVDDAMAKSNRKRPVRRAWSAQAKVDAVMKAASLSGDALGAWLRSEGLHDDDIQRFREEVRAAAVSGLDNKNAKAAASSDAKRIKELERELKRSNAALAETAALLVLRKKASALWGEEGDDT